MSPDVSNILRDMTHSQLVRLGNQNAQREILRRRARTPFTPNDHLLPVSVPERAIAILVTIDGMTAFLTERQLATHVDRRRDSADLSITYPLTPTEKGLVVQLRRYVWTGEQHHDLKVFREKHDWNP